MCSPSALPHDSSRIDVQRPYFSGSVTAVETWVLIFGNGKAATYGPCYRPASINRLWAELTASGPPG